MVTGRSLPTAVNEAWRGHSVARERRRGKERKEEEERVVRQFKHLSRVTCFSATSIHPSHDI
jgi:hypothetical protein